MSQKRWHPNPNVRDLETDYPVDTSESDVNPLMYSAVGGSTILYAAHWQRFMPSDFRVKTLDGVADDWPFTYEDLEPYYDQMDIEMGVSALNGDPAYPPGKASPSAAAAHRQDRHEGGRRDEQAGLALVAGTQCHPVEALCGTQSMRALGHLPDGLSRTGEGVL